MQDKFTSGQRDMVSIVATLTFNISGKCTQWSDSKFTLSLWLVGGHQRHRRKPLHNGRTSFVQDRQTPNQPTELEHQTF